MKIHINFRKIKESEEIKQYAKSKILRELEKFSNSIEKVEVVLGKEGLRFTCKCHMTGGRSLSLNTEGLGDETHEAVDQMIKKTHNILRKNKEKTKEHRGVAGKFYRDTLFADLYEEEEKLEDIKKEKEG